MRPSSVEINRDKQLVKIDWQDGHRSAYSFDGLRAVCPCVECKGGHAHMGGPPDPRTVRDAPLTALSVTDVQQLGSYALQFFWSDGHSTGLYTWETLRQACPCAICLPVD